MPDDIFRWVITGAVILACAAFIWQAFVVAALYRAGKEAHQAGKDIQNRIGPLVDRFEAVLTSAGKILEENRPKIADITAETLVIVKAARQQAERIGELMNDANDRARSRIAQIDHAVDRTVAQVENAGDTVRSVVMRPVKEVSGLVNGVKAAFTAYGQGGRRHSVEHATQDEEMFI
jgi:ABC-type transporter Mla subunit MlaD